MSANLPEIDEFRRDSHEMRLWYAQARKAPVELIDPSIVNKMYALMQIEWLEAIRSTTTSAARANAFHTWVTWAKEVIQAQSAGKQREQQRDVTPESMLWRDADRDSTSGS
jgi:hypothetical protein